MYMYIYIYIYIYNVDGNIKDDASLSVLSPRFVPGTHDVTFLHKDRLFF